jgi:hypothetical protein
MTTTTSVFLPDEQEHKTHKKPPQSAQPNAHGSDATDSADPYAEIRKLNEHELKAAIKSVWKHHDESAKRDLAPLMYYLREQLRAQGARNDLANSDRGFAAWVEENLDISRRTADRWCEWFAVETGLKPGTSGHVTKGSGANFYVDILNEHEGHEQIAFNCWVKKAVHAEFTKALTKLQRRFGLKNKKEAIVQGVIYAASAINRGAKGKVPMVARAKSKVRHKPVAHRSNGHRGGSGSKVMRAAAGR